MIDDEKYLIAILVGRKLQLAAQACSAEEYNQQVSHLKSFIDKIIADEGLLKTSSSDITYLSLRTALLNIKEYSFILKDKKINHSKLEALKQSVLSLRDKCEEAINDATKNLTLLCVSMQKEDYENQKTACDKNGSVPNLKKDEDYSKFRVILDGSEVSDEVLKNILKKAFGFEPDNNVLASVRNNISAINNIKLLCGKLEELVEIVTISGQTGVLVIVKEIEAFFEEVDKAFLNLSSQKSELFKNLRLVYSNVQCNMAYKVNYAQIAWSSVESEDLVKQEIFHLLSLLKNSSFEQLLNDAMADVEKIKTPEFETVVNSFKGFLEQLKQNNLPNSVQMRVELTSQVMMDLEDLLKKSDITPEELEQIKQYCWKMLEELENVSFGVGELFNENADLQDKLLEANKTLMTLDAKLKSVTEENEHLNQVSRDKESSKDKEISALQSELADTRKYYDGLLGGKIGLENKVYELYSLFCTSQQEDNERLQPLNTLEKIKSLYEVKIKEEREKNSIEDSISKNYKKITGVLDQFLDEYISGCSFGTMHGWSGADRAIKLKADWKIIKEGTYSQVLDYQSKDNSILAIIKLIQQRLDDLISRQKSKLKGRFDEKSLKTYLLAYYKYLANLGVQGFENSNIVVNYKDYILQEGVTIYNGSFVKDTYIDWVKKLTPSIGLQSSLFSPANNNATLSQQPQPSPEM